MNSLFETLQQLILDPFTSESDYIDFRKEVEAFQKQADPLKRALTHPLARLSRALQYLHDEREDRATGTSDLVTLIRQVVLLYHRPLKVPSELWHLLRDRAYRADLYCLDEGSPIVTIRADTWQPKWIDGGRPIKLHELERRRRQEPVLGDGLLSAISGGKYYTYLSMGQKYAVDRVLFAPPGSTTLVTLPTGAGKSLVGCLPAWFSSQGGRRIAGTTIIVTPTVSLALDQYRQVKDFFSNAVAPTYQPQCLTSDSTADERSTIYQGIQEGTLPLLYTSPEGLLSNQGLYSVVLEAAEKGRLNWLVIDEAHIADAWGAGFRTEFQLLASYRRKLIAASHGELRTLLLSATITEHTRHTLERLFASRGEMHTLSANQLRPEINYMFAVAENEEQRRKWVLEALYHLPRPAILYVMTPLQTQEWVALLRENGFRRLAAYSGDTVAIERRAILREWEHNERDLIVATSAFGLGVDKGDIRTVIHAGLPENIDRFYQEVGRGGRDGFSTISLAVTVVEEDYGLARSMMRSARISTEKSWHRWKGMWNRSVPYLDRGDERLINLDSVPSYNPEINPGDTHRNWNEHILLLLQRAGLIQVEDTQPENVLLESTEEEPGYRKWIHIRLVKPSKLDNYKEFISTVSRHRDRERHYITQGLNRMKAVAEQYGVGTKLSKSLCISNVFADIYHDTARACGGCPSCRHVGRRPFAYAARVYWENPRPLNWLPPMAIPPQVKKIPDFVAHGSVNAVWGGVDFPRDQILELVNTAASVGFAQIVLTDELLNHSEWAPQLTKALARYSLLRQRVLLDRWLEGEGPMCWKLYSIPSLIVYSKNPKRADFLYRRVRREINDSEIIHVVDRSLELPSENGRFVDKVAGLQKSLGYLTKMLIEKRDAL